MKKGLTIYLFLLFPMFLFAQGTNCNGKLITDSVSHDILFDYKPHTEKFRIPLGYAAQFFPELKGCKIEVKRKKIATMMAARPKKNYLLHSKENRTYEILITDKHDMHADSIYNKMSTCAMIGVFGHELSHILTYTQKNNSKLSWFGIKYVFNRKKIENETDMIAIKHGFGPELVEYTNFIHQTKWANKRYLHKKKKYYLSATELESKLTGTY